MTIAPELAARLRRSATLTEADPLAYWHHSSPQTRTATEWAIRETEVYLRKPNKCGGTEWGAALILALLQGRETLDGIALPRLDSKVPTAIVASLDYKQQVLSVQAAYERLIGQWPHHDVPLSRGVLSAIHVRPLRASTDDWHGWPAIHFVSQENPRAGVGYRGDLFHFDEPAKPAILRELRKAAHPGRRWARIHTVTPLLRSQWWPLQQDFAGCTGTPYRGRVEVHLDDVRWCLSSPDNPRGHLNEKAIQDLLDAYRGDPLAVARLTAAYQDTSGLSPWARLSDVLDAMLAECREPERMEWQITREVASAGGMAKVVERVEVEVWSPPRPGRRGYIPVDASYGVEAEGYDPGGLHVVDSETGDLWARYVGYIGAYGLGVLAAGLAAHYGKAIVDPETQGGYGGPVLTALADCGYRNVAHAERQQSGGRLVHDLGFRTTTGTRPEMFAAIRQWLEDWRAGHRYARCPSREVIQCLKDLVLDARGKPVAAPGFHDEDAILRGQSLRRVVRPRRVPPPPPSRELDRSMRVPIPGVPNLAPHPVVRPWIRVSR